MVLWRLSVRARPDGGGGTTRDGGQEILIVESVSRFLLLLQSWKSAPTNAIILWYFDHFFTAGRLRLHKRTRKPWNLMVFWSFFFVADRPDGQGLKKNIRMFWFIFLLQNTVKYEDPSGLLGLCWFFMSGFVLGLFFTLKYVDPSGISTKNWWLKWSAIIVKCIFINKMFGQSGVNQRRVQGLGPSPSPGVRVLAVGCRLRRRFCASKIALKEE